MTMKLGLTFAAAALLLGLASTVPVFADDDAAALLETIRKDEAPEAFDQAVKKLRAMDSRTQYLLEKELQTLLMRYRKDLEKVDRTLDRLAGEPEEERSQLEARIRWEQSREEARKFIADTDAFVDVYDRPMVSPGADTARALGNAALKAFGHLEPGLRKDLSQCSRLSEQSAARLRAEHFAARIACDRVAVAMGLTGAGGEVRELPQFLLDIGEGKLSNAAERFSRLPSGRERLRGFYAYSDAILTMNRTLLGSDQAPGAKGLLTINGYRMALGLSPLPLNRKLMAAADGHSAEMKELSFYGNDSPTPGRKTEKERAALAGYTDPVTQFIHTGSSIQGALPVWIGSAIHHRLLVGTEFIEAGFGVSGPLTLVLGMGEKTTPPLIQLRAD